MTKTLPKDGTLKVEASQTMSAPRGGLQEDQMCYFPGLNKGESMTKTLPRIRTLKANNICATERSTPGLNKGESGFIKVKHNLV